MIEEQLQQMNAQMAENNRRLGIVKKQIEKLLENQERLFTAREAARFLRMSYAKFIQMYKKEIPYIQRNKKLLFRLKDLVKWMEDNTHPIQ